MDITSPGGMQWGGTRVISSHSLQIAGDASKLFWGSNASLPLLTSQCRLLPSEVATGAAPPYHQWLSLGTSSLWVSGSSKRGDVLLPYIIIKLNHVRFSFIRWAQGYGRYFSKYRKHHSKLMVLVEYLRASSIFSFILRGWANVMNGIIIHTCYFRICFLSWCFAHCSSG